MAVAGDVIAVGSVFDDVGNSDQGSAYVFAKPGGGWADMTQTAKLSADDGGAGDEFGVSVSISGDTIVVGARWHDVDANPDQGSAYLFVEPGGGWADMAQTAKLTTSDGASNDLFSIVSISGDTVVVGARWNDVGANNQGSAYVFVKPGGAWIDMNEETGKLTASDGAMDDWFGDSVSISGDVVVVGAYRHDVGANIDQGSAYVFVKPTGGWCDLTESAKLPAADGASNDQFGVSLSISGNTIVVGADQDDVGGNVNQGSAHVFTVGIVFVDESATGADDGTSWTDAYTRLQDALVYASTHPEISEIWVAAGTYKPTEKSCTVAADCGGAPNSCPAGLCVWDQPREQTFQLQSGVALYGGFAGGETLLGQRNPAVNVTILGGDLAGNDGPNFTNYGENSFHVLTGSGANATAILDGFAITAGNANGDFPADSGAGMYNNSGSPTITKCTLSGNSANSLGGGIFNDNSSNPTLTECAVNANRSNFQGGGMLNVNNSSPLVTNCTFTGNEAGAWGGAMYNATNSNPTMSNCAFITNSAGASGGAIYNTIMSNPNLINCKFLGNSAVGGAGMQNVNSSPNVNNTTFIANVASSNGGGMSNDGSNPVVTHCTFFNNGADMDGGAIYNLNTSNPVVENSILWDNFDDADGGNGGPYIDESAQIHTVSGVPTVSYSCVQGGWSGAGSNNIGADPLFVDSDGSDNVIGTLDDDLRLSSGSPAIDAASTPALPLDADDADGDGNTTEPYPFDLAGNPRVLDDPATSDMGGPGSPDVDMGAYEFFTDCNGNDLPDVCDLSCGAPLGPCDLPGCGLDNADCNGNMIHDACDLDNCMGSPACDDCNLNGIPDACDITTMTSQDVNPTDGIPDECVAAISDNGCNGSNDWTCGGNWPLGGTDYPDNQDSVPDLVVTMSAVSLFLDEDVEVDSLRLINGANLDVTQSGTPGDLVIDPPMMLPAAEGDLVLRGLIPPPRLGMFLRGQLLVANNRSVEVLAAATEVGDGGTLELAPTGGPFTDDGAFTTGDLIVRAGGGLELDGSGVLTVNGTLLLDGTDADPMCPGFGLRGLLPAPRFSTTRFLLCAVAADFVISGSAEVLFESSENLELAGSFLNEGTLPGCFFWPGGLTMTGVGKTFEVAGRNVGPTINGFYVLGDANFSMGSVVLGPAADVRFQNTFANTLGASACQEALYVQRLELGAGALLRVDDCKVYYADSVPSGLTCASPNVQCIGCGQLLPLPLESACDFDPACGDGDLCTNDCRQGNLCVHQPIPSLVYGDVSLSVTGVVDVDDILAVLDGFAGGFNGASQERVDLAPCGPLPSCVTDENCQGLAPGYGAHCVGGACRCISDADCETVFGAGSLCRGDKCSVIDVDDILAILDAFAGTANCPDPCGP